MPRPVNLFFTTGGADCLTAPNGDRRFFAVDARKPEGYRPSWTNRCRHGIVGWCVLCSRNGSSQRAAGARHNGTEVKA